MRSLVLWLTTVIGLALGVAGAIVLLVQGPASLMPYLQAAVVAFSLFAAWFWLASAVGSPPFRFGPTRVDAALLPAFQARWNARAAFCAAFAALAQGLIYLFGNWPLPPAPPEQPFGF